MTGRERIINALNFKPVDRIPKDLGGMNSTGLSAFLYPELREYLGLAPAPTVVHDPVQMLALPAMDMLDALNCDVVNVFLDDYTNVFYEPEKWREYSFNGRLNAFTGLNNEYRLQADGSILLHIGESEYQMPAGGFVFNCDHAGQIIDFSGELNKPDIKKISDVAVTQIFNDSRVKSISTYMKKVRSATDRAVFFNGVSANLGFWGGMSNFSMLCMTEPGLVKEFHEVKIQKAIEIFAILLPEIHKNVDIIHLDANDLGVQNNTILPPDVIRELYVPYYKKLNDVIHKIAPEVKTFLHSCGAIYSILDDIIDCGFDALNPVQWSAGSHSFKEWKEKARGRIALWGGGVNTQTTLPLGSLKEIEDEVKEVAAYLAKDSGFVFSPIHNLLAEITPLKAAAVYQAV